MTRLLGYVVLCGGIMKAYLQSPAFATYKWLPQTNAVRAVVPAESSFAQVAARYSWSTRKKADTCGNAGTS